MALSLRSGNPSDGPSLGDICFRAFNAIAEPHGFAPDFPNPDVTTGLLTMLIGHPGFFDVVAEVDGRIVGSNFLDERNPIAGVGPVTVDPGLQNGGVGRALMQRTLDRCAERGFAGARLVQAGYHLRTLALYLRLGFEVREPLACMQGAAIGEIAAGSNVRPANVDDVAECNRLCVRVHGHDRSGELADAVAQGVARVVVREGRITGYAAPIAFFGHAVAETNDDLQSLIGAAESFPGPGFLVPSRNGALLRWCLGNGLRITQTMTLMTKGLYNEPQGAWLPSVTY